MRIIDRAIFLVEKIANDNTISTGCENIANIAQNILIQWREYDARKVPKLSRATLHYLLALTYNEIWNIDPKYSHESLLILRCFVKSLKKIRGEKNENSSN